MAGLSGLFWLIFAALIGISEYGELGYLISISQVGYAIASLGLSHLIVVYGAKKEDVYSSAFLLGIISTTIVSVIIYYIIQNISVIVLMWGLLIFMLFQSEQNSKKKYISYAKYGITQRALIIIFALGLYFILEIDGIILGSALACFVGSKAIYNFFKNRELSLSKLKPKLGFIRNVYFTNLITTFFWWGDKLLIGQMFGFVILGNYQLAVQYILLLHAIPVALMVYLLPQEAQGLENKRLKITALFISIILSIVSFLAIPYAVNNLLPDYHNSIEAMQLMSFAIIPIVISTIIESVFLGREKSNFVLAAICIQVGFYFSLILVLGNQFGLMGIALSFLISTIARSIFYLISYQLKKTN